MNTGLMKNSRKLEKNYFKKMYHKLYEINEKRPEVRSCLAKLLTFEDKKKSHNCSIIFKKKERKKRIRQIDLPACTCICLYMYI